MIALCAVALATVSGCNVERRKSDAELGLNPQQAAGRKIFAWAAMKCPRLARRWISSKLMICWLICTRSELFTSIG
jgi:hypothetical protein